MPLTPKDAFFLSKCAAFLLLVFSLAACSAGKTPASTASSTPAATQTPLRVVNIKTSTQTPLPPSATPDPTMTFTAISPVAEISGTDTGHFISETVPDNTQVEHGENFRKTWLLRNSGSRTWTDAYELYLVSSVPDGVDMHSPQAVPLTASVAPGGQVEVGVDLTAPQADGVYTLYYALRDAEGNHIPVDGGNIWVTVRVGDASVGEVFSGSPAYAPQLLSSSRTTQLVSVQYCMQLPDSTPSWFPFGEELITPNQRIPASGGGVSNYQPGSYRCFFTEFDVSAASLGAAEPLQVSVGGISIDSLANREENCSRAQSEVGTAHPGLEFTCSAMGFYYTLVTRPSGMSDAEADRIIMDALERRVYGPWVMSLP